MMHRQNGTLSRLGLSLYGIVKQKPGIHFRALGRAAQITSVGQLRHHIDRLEHEGLLIEVEDGGFTRFFAAGEQDPQIRPALARFARRVTRQIGSLLLERPMNRTELRKSLGCADSTLGFHLARMLAQGDLVKHRERNCCRYELTDRTLVHRVLLLRSPLEESLMLPTAGPAGAAMNGNGSHVPAFEPPAPAPPAPAPTDPAPEPLTPDPVPAPEGIRYDEPVRAGPGITVTKRRRGTPSDEPPVAAS